jgi:glycosyltransferase involved in cell wall biosynthesis
MPLVSVVIPTYNAGQFIAAALDSVLSQSFRDLEVVVVDDGSTDDTEARMQAYGTPIRYLRQKNAGVAVARNRGIAESRSKYIAFLDADDTWFPNKLGRQIDALSSHPGVRACYSAFQMVDAQLRSLGVPANPRRAGLLEDLLMRGNVIGSICTVLAERTLFDEVGAFDPTLSQCADWDMWVRIGTRTDALYLDEPLVTYRQHAANMSRNARLLEEDSLRVLRKAFDMNGLSESLRARRRQAFGRNYRVLAGTYFQSGQVLAFMRCTALSVTLDPRQLGYFLRLPLRARRRRLGKTSATPQ